MIHMMTELSWLSLTHVIINIINLVLLMMPRIQQLSGLVFMCTAFLFNLLTSTSRHRASCCSVRGHITFKCALPRASGPCQTRSLRDSAAVQTPLAHLWRTWDGIRTDTLSYIIGGCFRGCDTSWPITTLNPGLSPWWRTDRFGGRGFLLTYCLRYEQLLGYKLSGADDDSLVWRSDAQRVFRA